MSAEPRFARWLTRSASALPRRRRVLGAILTAGGLPLVTFLLTLGRDSLSLSSVLLIYVLGVTIVAAVGGGVVGAVAAVASALCANYYFTAPLHTFRVNIRDELVAVSAYLAVALIVSALVEVAARRRVDAMRAQELTEIDRVRSALLAAVGHDFRTPLAGMKAAVSSLRQRDVAWTDQQRDELLATMEESTDELDRLLANLLDMSRLRAGVLSVRLRPVALDEVVASALLGTPGQQIDIDVPDDLPMVNADPGLLERVIANLIANALRFTPDGDRVAVTATSASDVVQLRVIDHGPGIAAADRTRVFAPFQQLDDRSRGSLGLGLAIARGFVEAMGGGIVPSDTTGGGLTMTVTLRVPS